MEFIFFLIIVITEILIENLFSITNFNWPNGPLVVTFSLANAYFLWVVRHK